MTYPAAPTNEDTSRQIDDAGYDLAPEPPPALHRVVPVAAATAPAPTKVLTYRSTRAATDKPDLDTEKLTRQTLPLWLLTGGLLVECAIAFVRAHFDWSDPNVVMLHMLFDVGFSTVVMMFGVLIAAKVRQIPIGSVPSALMRLAALIVATRAADDILHPLAYFLPFAGILILLANFALYFALLGAFFDLDQDDTWFCVCVIFIIHIALYFAVITLV